MRNYYLPEIFNHNMDGIDQKRHIVATYYMKDTIEGRKFLDHFDLIQALALEGSTGTWEKVAEHDEKLRKRLAGKMIGYFEVPNTPDDTKEAVVQLAFNIDAWEEENLPMMLLSISGNCFAYSDDLRLVDVSIPDDLLDKFKGPQFGISGIRELTGVEDRPLSLHIIKPKMGMTPKQVANQCYQTAIGGVDMIKDDEMTSDVYNSKFEDRIKEVMAALKKAKEKTGKMPIYLVSITDEVGKMYEKAKRAVELGANGLLITYSAGLSAFKRITEDEDIDIPVMMHASHMIAAKERISWPVFAKLCRLCGADQMLTPTIWSSIPMVSHEEGLRTAQVKLAPWGHIKRTFPMPCAGIYPGLAPVLVGEYGPDIIIPAGGGMLGHPDGYTEGAKAWQQAIAGAMKTETDDEFIEFAKNPENKELRSALEKWGIPERPESPWLRAAPELHPKPMSFE